ncbi:hypothetical protein LTR53_009263 [Teratosphaeriaceae sp. CCFEE 6253]|nr:hypothetical protein LTR53_009263 [Teratosphaeriaceae sp. CCFEE 6253]
MSSRANIAWLPHIDFEIVDAIREMSFLGGVRQLTRLPPVNVDVPHRWPIGLATAHEFADVYAGSFLDRLGPQLRPEHDDAERDWELEACRPGLVRLIVRLMRVSARKERDELVVQAAGTGSTLVEGRRRAESAPAILSGLYAPALTVATSFDMTAMGLALARDSSGGDGRAERFYNCKRPQIAGDEDTVEDREDTPASTGSVRSGEDDETSDFMSSPESSPAKSVPSDNGDEFRASGSGYECTIPLGSDEHGKTVRCSRYSELKAEMLAHHRGDQDGDHGFSD